MEPAILGYDTLLLLGENVNGLCLRDGSNVGVATTARARIRYLDASKSLQASFSGGAYFDIGSGGEFNVKAYGAVGDGIADDRAAIQAAIDFCHAAGGGVVYLPPGIYLLKSYTAVVPAHVLGVVFRMRPNVTIRGAGIDETIIRLGPGMCTNTCQAALFCQIAWDVGGESSCDNVVFEDFTWDGNGVNNLITVYSYWGDCHHIETSSSVITRRIREVNNPGSHCFAVGNGTYPHTCKYFEVTDCSCTNVGSQITGNTRQTDHSTIYGNAETVSIHDNHFLADYDDAGNALGLVWWTAIEIHAKWGEIYSNESSNFRNCVNIGAQVNDLVCVEVHDNIGRNCWSGVTLWTAQLPEVHSCDRVHIHDNDFAQPTTDWDFPMIDCSTAISNSKPNDLVIENNRLTGTAVASYCLDATLPMGDKTLTSASNPFVTGGRIADGVMTAGSKRLTSLSNPFVVGDVGKQIVVWGADLGGIRLITYIESFVSAGEVRLAQIAMVAVAAAAVTWGDVDKNIFVRGAGAGGGHHYTTIDSVTNPGEVEVHDAAITGVVGTEAKWGYSATSGCISVGACRSAIVRGNVVRGTRGPAVELAIPNIGWTMERFECVDNTAVDCCKEVGGSAPFESGFYLGAFGTVTIFRVRDNVAINTTAGLWMDTGFYQSGVTRTLTDIRNNTCQNIRWPFFIAGYVPDPESNGFTWQSFILVLTNDGGTIKHKIVDTTISNLLPFWCNLINGASAAFAATPTLAVGTPFMSGVGYSAAVPGGSEISFDTPEQTGVVGIAADQYLSMTADLLANDNGDAIQLDPLIRTEDVGGVTRSRLAVSAFVPGSFVAYPLTVANILAGNTIYIRLCGYLRK